ncbi:MAG: polysaccharide pyruvyl transferase family protein [Lachnospiraceae bacterium]|nr:polysaccharide pyruvyl transferase family protein [Lachnospiraceae bacterium]
MKKIGILTFYYKNYNCGGLLQAYALQRVIDSMDGIYSEQICFVRDRKKLYLRKVQELVSDPSQITYMIKVRANEKIKSSKSRNDQSIKKSIIKYDEFMESIPHSMVVNSSTSVELNEIYDAFVVGSDQVWNPVYVPMDFFFDFVHKKPKLSYAASIRVNQFRKKEGQRIKELLDSFSYISVREKKGIDLLRSIGVDSNIDVMPDPTLLLEKEDWDKIKQVPEINCKYIFVYLVVNNEALEKIRNYALKNNLKVVWVNGPEYYFDSDDVFVKVNSGIGPREFIGLIENSEFNIVDSFHGAVFSIIYNRPFYVYGSLSGDDRKKTLLEMTNLTSRCIPYSFDFSKIDLNIDYSMVNQILTDTRKAYITKWKQIIKTYVPVKINNDNSKSVISTIPYDQCTGCGVCAAICPTGAITLKQAEDGFLHPFLDAKKCINCGKCSKGCPTLMHFKKPYNQCGYSYSLSNSKELRTCSSGGIATALAKDILKSHGIVYAVRYSLDFHDICFDRFSSLKDIQYIKGTKYSESFPIDYKKLYDDVESGKKVIVFGLPCQIAAVRSYLGKKQYDNLICVALVCQGKASLTLYRKLISELENNVDSKVERINMRWKKTDWSANWLAVKFKNGSTIEQPFDSTPYGMLCHKALRSSCFNCRFKMDNSPSDIQIGDFWGSEFLPEEKQNNMGLSCVITFTEKGKKIVDGIGEGNLAECSVDSIVSGNGAIVKSEKICKNYHKLVESIQHYSLRKVCSMYLGKGTKIKTKVGTFIKTNISSDKISKIRKIKKRLKG